MLPPWLTLLPIPESMLISDKRIAALPSEPDVALKCHPAQAFCDSEGYVHV